MGANFLATCVTIGTYRAAWAIKKETKRYPQSSILINRDGGIIKGRRPENLTDDAKQFIENLPGNTSYPILWRIRNNYGISGINIRPDATVREIAKDLNKLRSISFVPTDEDAVNPESINGWTTLRVATVSATKPLTDNPIPSFPVRFAWAIRSILVKTFTPAVMVASFLEEFLGLSFSSTIHQGFGFIFGCLPTVALILTTNLFALGTTLAAQTN